MSSLHQLLSAIPQSSIHHPEGNVYKHSKMVVWSYLEAKVMLGKAKYPCFDNLNFNQNCPLQDIQLLEIAGWLHDIGKVSATTLNIEGHHIPFNKELILFASWGRWQAIDHERPEHYKPMMRKLSGFWKRLWWNSSFEDRKDLFFMINHHMDLKSYGFSYRLSKKLIDANGCYKNKRRIKLLIILIMMDRLGRGFPKEKRIQEALDTIQAFQTCADDLVYRLNKPQTQPAPNDPKEFIRHLSGKPKRIIAMAFKGKFDREPTEEELMV